MNRFEKELTVEVKRMGDSPKKIAAFLKRRHVRGTLGSQSRCPVANYLRETFSEPTVSVNTVAIRVDGVSICLGRPMKRFILAFDEGVFPKLEKG